MLQLMLDQFLIKPEFENERTLPSPGGLIPDLAFGEYRP
jgi:hypothetical protein